MNEKSLVDIQIEEWVKGNPVHNRERDECTPDFSCCQRELLAPETERIKFRDARLNGDRGTVDSMLAGFLGKMLKANDFEVETSEGISSNG